MKGSAEKIYLLSLIDENRVSYSGVSLLLFKVSTLLLFFESNTKKNISKLTRIEWQGGNNCIVTVLLAER